jgi:beta-fructofuranosidase
MVEQRPAYHFLPPPSWMNDPNGPIQWDGVYHLFYQHNPDRPWWGNMRWGHARSADLVHWERLPIALAPGPADYDREGIWSGCCVDDDGTPSILYTGHPSQAQCLARGSDDLAAWTKHPGNPVIPGPPEGMKVTGFRDPFAWREDDGWYLVVGSGIEGVGGAALLYRSPDLVNWEYLGPLCTGDKEKTGVMWECPSFFPLGGKHVLAVSPYGKVVCFIGDYAGHRFTPQHRCLMDLGDPYYAPNCFLDDRGRRIMWGWIKECLTEEQHGAQGWAGVMTLPRVLDLGDDGRLRVSPAEEVEALRGEHVRLENVTMKPGAANLLDAVSGDCLELLARVEPGDTTALGLRVRCSPDGEEQTLITWDADIHVLAAERQQSSAAPDADLSVHAGEFDPPAGEPLELRVFVDRSVIEVFANGRAALTTRVYPTRDDSLGVGLFACGGEGRLISLDAWHMKSIWD